MKKKILFVLITYYFLASCNQTTPTKKLEILKEQDFLNDKNNNEILLGDLRDIVELDQKFLIIDGLEKDVFITNHEFEVLRKISLKDKQYLFTGNIFSATYHRNKLYIIDNSFSIKILDLSTEQIAVLNYKLDQNSFMSFIQNIKIVDDSSFVCSASGIVIRPSKHDLFVGARYNFKGEIISAFSIPFSELDYNSFFQNSGQGVEFTYVNYYDKNVYFSFSASKKVLKYDLKGHLLKIYDLMIDEKYWQPPHKDEKGNFWISITSYPIEINNGRIFQVVDHGIGISPSIYEYDMNFVKLNEYVPKEDIISGYHFILKFFDGKFFLKDIPGPLFYILKPSQ
jgi:hypothetical protein